MALVAHGSADVRFAATVEAIAARVRSQRPGLDVRVGYLEHGPPSVPDAAAGAIVVPLLLSGGYHLLVDIPGQAPGAPVTPAVGPDPRLATAMAARLREAGYDGQSPVVLAAAGSADDRALADARTAARHLADALGVEVSAAYVSAGEPRLAALAPQVVASYLVAPGAFHDACRAVGAAVVGEPIGDHPAVAEVVLDRYDAVAVARQVPGRTAPA